MTHTSNGFTPLHRRTTSEAAAPKLAKDHHTRNVWIGVAVALIVALGFLFGPAVGARIFH